MNKVFRRVKQNVVQSRAFQASIVAVGSALAAPAAFAQTLPTEVDTAIENAGLMLVAGATAVIIAMVAFWALKKLGGKMGWW